MCQQQQPGSNHAIPYVGGVLCSSMGFSFPWGVSYVPMGSANPWKYCWQNVGTGAKWQFDPSTLTNNWVCTN